MAQFLSLWTNSGPSSTWQDASASVPSRLAVTMCKLLKNNMKISDLSRRVVVAGLTAGASGLLLPRIALGGVASAIRISERAGDTRVVVELSQPVDFSIFRLADPYRIVVDLPELEWAAAPGTRAGLVHTVRYGLFQPGDSRLVIDLAEAADIKSAAVQPASNAGPARLVIDLVRTTRERFLAAVGPQNKIGKFGPAKAAKADETRLQADRKSTRLNSSHTDISRMPSSA